MPAVNGKRAEKTKGRSIDVLSAIRSTPKVKATFLCLAHVLIIAMTKLNWDNKYKYLEIVNL